MKVLRKILKLFPPAFLMRRWLDRRYGIKVPPAPGGALARLVLAVLPYAFTAALSVRVESDCRLLKYFLPYGKMKRLVYLSYRMRVGNDRGRSNLVDRRAVRRFDCCLYRGYFTLDHDRDQPPAELLLPGQELDVRRLAHRVYRDDSRNVAPNLK